MTLSEFLDPSNSKETIYLVKPNGRKFYILWWDDQYNDFLNVLFTNTNIKNPKYSKWIMRSEAVDYIGNILEAGYKIQKKV